MAVADSTDDRTLVTTCNQEQNGLSCDDQKNRGFHFSHSFNADVDTIPCEYGIKANVEKKQCFKLGPLEICAGYGINFRFGNQDRRAKDVSDE